MLPPSSFNERKRPQNKKLHHTLVIYIIVCYNDVDNKTMKEISDEIF